MDLHISLAAIKEVNYTSFIPLPYLATCSAHCYAPLIELLNAFCSCVKTSGCIEYCFFRRIESLHSNSFKYSCTET